MEIVTLMTLVMVLAMISMMYKTNYILTMILSLEVILLKLTVFKMYLSFEKSKLKLTQFSIFILTLSAVEASIGMSLMALLSRKFSSANVDSLKTLKK